ncbi:MAG: hypothetical protein AMXMBFR80_27310 [Dehalococcoidia bacterium]
MYAAAAPPATIAVVRFTNGKHYVRMPRPVPAPRAPRTLALSAIAATAVAGLLLFTTIAQAAAPGASTSGGTRASGANTPLAVAGLAFLSTGLLVLARSRAGTVRAPRLLPAIPAGTRPAAPQPTGAQPPAAAAAASLAPLAAIAGALHATAGALDIIATELPRPEADSVASSAERVREAHITLARWLEGHR